MEICGLNCFSYISKISLVSLSGYSSVGRAMDCSGYGFPLVPSSILGVRNFLNYKVSQAKLSTMSHHGALTYSLHRSAREIKDFFGLLL